MSFSSTPRPAPPTLNTASNPMSSSCFGPQPSSLGEHGMPRIDTSDQVYFQNDQIGVRFIEEIDFDYCAQDATAALITAAA
jgi:hypothetical protein